MKSRNGSHSLRGPLDEGPCEPEGAFGWFSAFARVTYLPTVSRLMPRRSAISRLECSVMWSVRILSISAIVSRFAILSSVSKGFAEG